MIKVKDIESFSSSKVKDLKDITKLVSDLKAQGKTVGLCHGGFDLLHPGHVKHFESAKTLCDILVVSITSDRFIDKRKGDGRPIIPEILRAYSIACLEFVDYVTIADYNRGTEVLEIIKPTYYIKGPDYKTKTTPGITAERAIIKKVGGAIKYTSDVKMSTSEIIDYVKRKVGKKKLLLLIDRDGTIIENVDFLGRSENWKEKVRLKEDVIGYINYLNEKYDTTNIIVTNQSGVARDLFSCGRVEEINSYVNSLLKSGGVAIDNWQYCPDADASYAKAKPTYTFNHKFVKVKTKRKPDTMMVFDGLKELGQRITDFDEIVMLGDRPDDDGGLAKNLGAKFIDVTNKNLKQLISKFE